MSAYRPITRTQSGVACVAILFALAMDWSISTASGDDRRSGAQIYQEQCASCHGASGEGSDEYPLPLAGTRSVAQLAKFINKSMPKDAPKKCDLADSERVAAYIYDAFYSPLAQARNKPARVELSRLTVRQFRNAVADLVGSFRPPARWDEQRGLRGEYFKGRRFRDGERISERLDPEIHFDFGTAAPETESDKFDPHQFSIRWNGSMLAPDTGDYEFIVRTEHAARLWINDLSQPLIDAWVKSGDDTEYRATKTLLGGRVYSIRLEYSKAKQGVDDSAKRKEPPPAVKSSISLAWRLPKQPEQVIPSRYLSPHTCAETFVVTAPFPPDDRSIGYERGSSVSKAWDAATTEAAIEVASYVAALLSELTGKKDPDSAQLREFCRQLVERAFRRPLSDQEVQQFVHRRFDGAPDEETAVKRVVLLALKSPCFLYRELGSAISQHEHESAEAGGESSNGASPNQYDVASRLSFGLWDSLPDGELLRAAAAGELATRDQVARQAERMLSDLRTRSKIREFFLQWLKVDHVPDLAKDTNRYPGFDEALAADLRASLELFVDHVVWSERSDFRELLRADSLYLNGRLARFYGAELDSNAPFQLVSLDPSERAGVLSHPYLMASFAYTETSSPIHRGVFLARSMLGRSLKPPPEAFTPLPAELHPNLTTRERVMLQTKPDACVQCHSMINPLGFTLEHFDAVGRFRDQENGKPIDASGGYLSRTGESLTFTGVRDFANFLAASEEAHTAFTEQLFQNLVKQPVRAYGPDTMEKLYRSFQANDFNMQKLMVEIVTVAATNQN